MIVISSPGGKRIASQTNLDLVLRLAPAVARALAMVSPFVVCTSAACSEDSADELAGAEGAGQRV